MNVKRKDPFQPSSELGLNSNNNMNASTVDTTKGDEDKSSMSNNHNDKKRSFATLSDERDEKQGTESTSSLAALSIDRKQTRAPPPSPIQRDSNETRLAALAEAPNKAWWGEGRFHLTEPVKTEAAINGSTPKKGSREIKYRSSPATSQRSQQGTHGESSSFLLFGNSFDTLSESGEYHVHSDNFGGHASPRFGRLAGHSNPGTPRVEIALPELRHSHSESDASLGDVSPIKVARGQAPSSGTPPGATDSFHLNLANSGQYPTRHYPPRGHGWYGGTKASFHPAGIQPAPPQFASGYAWSHGHPQHPGFPPEGESHVSNPLYVIRSCQKAFVGFTYLLPCLRETMISVNLNRYGHIRRYEGNPEKLDAGSMELVIATRRVETAICVFGGSLNPRKSSQTSSIFRLRETGSATRQYEQELPQRYQVTESRISWDVEANPPVEPARTPTKDEGLYTAKGSNGATKGSPHVIVVDDTPGGKREGSRQSSSPTPSADESDKKQKYRCKLCGQPKQNHNCSFRQSLQRSIGVQVYSAVNAYTASEPGAVAPNLSKMNNFVSYDSSGGIPSHIASSPPDARYSGMDSDNNAERHPSTVTPQTIRDGSGGVEVHSPQSSLSTHSQEMSPQVASASRSGPGSDTLAPPGNGHYHVHFSHPGSGPGDKKRSRIADRPYHHTCFAPSVALKPEHYRAVTPYRSEDNSRMAPGSYQYARVPVTFAERKRLSDTLFFFSKEIPSMTRDCGAILREAREKGEWDQAVAELLTQVVVGLYCGEGDSHLDGLQQYLLTLGVSC
ncbi:expressed unknown protein [Seminavis robusta]|uniref:Uncharacterized protein n=1 Tax=Seminavis robusta TaxID=568900 RepID=A0A9N8DHM1_9STRA|nr:expressed unknown protein [Seminavis robusta]|eukprot:Sro125_g060280.1 n/a (788) ;mRNA; f:70724-73366